MALLIDALFIDYSQNDFIARLLGSLAETLSDDPTPCEIIAYDDGSAAGVDVPSAAPVNSASKVTQLKEEVRYLKKDLEEVKGFLLDLYSKL